MEESIPIEIGPGTWISRSENVIFRHIPPEAVLVDLDMGRYFTTNETGAAVWQMLDVPQTVASIAEELCKQFDVNEDQSLADVVELVREMLGFCLVKIHEGKV